MSTYTFNVRYDYTFNNSWWQEATVNLYHPCYINNTAWSDPAQLWWGVMDWGYNYSGYVAQPDFAFGEGNFGEFMQNFSNTSSFEGAILGNSYLAVPNNTEYGDKLPSNVASWNAQGWDTSSQANLIAQLVTFFGNNFVIQTESGPPYSPTPFGQGDTFNLIVFDGTPNFDLNNRHIMAFCYIGNDSNAASQSTYSF